MSEKVKQWWNHRKQVKIQKLKKDIETWKWALNHDQMLTPNEREKIEKYLKEDAFSLQKLENPPRIECPNCYASFPKDSVPRECYHCGEVLRVTPSQWIKDWWSDRKAGWREFKEKYRDSPKLFIAYYGSLTLCMVLYFVALFALDNVGWAALFVGIGLFISFFPRIYYSWSGVVDEIFGGMKVE